MAHFVYVTEEIGHGGETPQARTRRAQILTMRIFVTQEVEQAEKDNFITAFTDKNEYQYNIQPFLSL